MTTLTEWAKQFLDEAKVKPVIPPKAFGASRETALDAIRRTKAEALAKRDIERANREAKDNNFDTEAQRRENKHFTAAELHGVISGLITRDFNYESPLPGILERSFRDPEQKERIIKDTALIQGLHQVASRHSRAAISTAEAVKTHTDRLRTIAAAEKAASMPYTPLSGKTITLTGEDKENALSKERYLAQQEKASLEKGVRLPKDPEVFKKNSGILSAAKTAAAEHIEKLLADTKGQHPRFHMGHVEEVLGIAKQAAHDQAIAQHLHGSDDYGPNAQDKESESRLINGAIIHDPEGARSDGSANYSHQTLDQRVDDLNSRGIDVDLDKMYFDTAKAAYSMINKSGAKEEAPFLPPDPKKHQLHHISNILREYGINHRIATR